MFIVFIFTSTNKCLNIIKINNYFIHKQTIRTTQKKNSEVSKQRHKSNNYNYFVVFVGKRKTRQSTSILALCFLIFPHTSTLMGKKKEKRKKLKVKLVYCRWHCFDRRTKIDPLCFSPHVRLLSKTLYQLIHLLLRQLKIN